jgi:uncharacterized CHY-type Zn-finger protein
MKLIQLSRVHHFWLPDDKFLKPFKFKCIYRFYPCFLNLKLLIPTTFQTNRTHNSEKQGILTKQAQKNTYTKSWFHFHSLFT